MYRQPPSMNESYRRNDTLANAKWERLGDTTTIVRQPIHSKNHTSNPEEPRIRPRWTQERQEQQKIDAATSLLEAMAIGNKKGKNQLCAQKQQSSAAVPVPKSHTASLLETLAKQQRRERWLEMLPIRPQSMGNVKRSRATRRFSEKDPKWNERIREVKAFVREYGHGRIPVTYPSNQELARWSKRQRFHYRLYLKNQRTKLLCGNSDDESERCYMTQEHIQDLIDAGFCFELPVAKWDRNYQLLKRSKFGPTQKHNIELKKWMEMQRFQMSLLKRGGKSLLNPERIQKLNDIGFAWNDTNKSILSKHAEEEKDFQRDFSLGSFRHEPFPDGLLCINDAKYKNPATYLNKDSVPTEILFFQTNTDTR